MSARYPVTRFVVCLLAVTLLLSPAILMAQNLARISGTVRSETGLPLFPASIGIEGKSLGTVTNESGDFSLYVPTNETLTLVVFFLGYENASQTLRLESGEHRTLTISLKEKANLIQDVEVKGIQQRENTLVPIDLQSIDQLPNASGNIETLIKTLPGVASSNELSSQYSVRGGSFDENLIYVNDIEIHRPLLIQSAQQEGLSFVNPDLVSSIQFSAGGFDAEYGDKLSSVLDIRYKKPTEFAGSASASLMGGSAHLEGSSKNHRLSYLTGVRYKTTRFLLASLDTKGDYNPAFTDAQSYLTYKMNRSWDISVLANVALNTFQQEPSLRETSFGNLQQAFNFHVDYQGQELDRFNSYMGALTVNYHPNDRLSLKLIGSGFHSQEEITYDFWKQYRINNLAQSSSGNRDSLINIGIGTTLEHARNYLNSNIVSLDHKGFYTTSNGVLKWGAGIQQEMIDDQIREWDRIDSAGYALEFNHNYQSDIALNSYRFTQFIQYGHKLGTSRGELKFTAGIRSQHWTYNREYTVSPRGNISFSPYRFRKITWHLASGLYHQPPFYKEIRTNSGELYRNKKAQRSWHVVSGMDYNFAAWGRPFVLSSELYYKQMSRVIPYQVDDVRIQYLPQYQAKAYATGIDFRVNGEFVQGEESWFSLSLLQTREDIFNDYIEKSDGTVSYLGYYRRPTDQWFNFSIFFRDNLPMNPNYKVFLLATLTSGLPYPGPIDNQPSVQYELGSYRRVDLGFSRVIIKDNKNRPGTREVWISLEILNVLGADNKVSYDWVRTVQSDYGLNAYFAVPNKLTGRAFNLRLSASF